jgi:hypothetical protein
MSSLHAPSLWSSQKLAAQYVFSETKRARGSFGIGLFTVFLVVMFVALLTNNVLKSPLIFLKISENTFGETDIMITPGIGINKQIVAYPPVPLVNETRYDLKMSGVGSISGAAPRWLIPAIVRSPTTSRNTTTFMLGIDSVREAAIGLGRSWTHPPLKTSECYISESILYQIGLATGGGQNVILDLSLSAFARILTSTSPSMSNGNRNATAYSALLALFPELNAALALPLNNSYLLSFRVQDLVDLTALQVCRAFMRIC